MKKILLYFFGVIIVSIVLFYIFVGLMSPIGIQEELFVLLIVIVLQLSFLIAFLLAKLNRSQK